MTRPRTTQRPQDTCASAQPAAGFRPSGLRNWLWVSAALLLLTGPVLALPPGFRVESQVAGLEQPVAFAFAPDGTIYVAERSTGRIRWVRDGQLVPQPVVTLDVSSAGERGLLGLALDPRFEENGYLYVFYTRTPTVQRITRFTIRAGRGFEETVIRDGIPAGVIHNGGCLDFGPDGKLYFSVGDNGQPKNSSRFSELPGKLHRINPDGTVPEDNPWRGRSAWCLGLRNCFGFDFAPSPDPVVIYASENGTTKNDEINRILRGRDYGWPAVSGAGTDDDGYEDPIWTWTPTVAPVATVLYRGAELPPEYHGQLFVAEYNTGRILVVFLTGDGLSVRRAETFVPGDYGPVLDLEVATDGSLWFSTTTTLFRVFDARPDVPFVRGDVDGLPGVTPMDAMTLLAYLVAQGPEPRCLSAGDANGDQRIDLMDVATLLRHAFGDLPGLPAPFPQCDTAPDSTLGCESFRHCR